MNIAVKGFKSIQDSGVVHLDGISMLAGANSSGKSSLLQALLLIQQSLETSYNGVLNLDGPYIYADEFKDLLYKKKDGLLQVELAFSRNELPSAAIEYKQYIPELIGLKYSVSFKVRNTKCEVYSSTIILNPGREAVTFTLTRAKGRNCYSGEEPSTFGNVTKYSDKVSFEGIFPAYVDVKDDKGNLLARPLIGFKLMKPVLKEWFNNVHIIYPSRVTPALVTTYNTTPQSAYIEPDAKNLLYVYAKHKNDRLQGDKTLQSVLLQWLMDLNLAHNFEVKENKKDYRSSVTNDLDLDVDLCQVGYGTGQILPILIQGLLTPQGGTLIVQDPDVHLHPLVQANLVDFFLSMVKEGKNVVIETHSDHMVTRLRRSIAEFPLVLKSSNLYYVEMTSDGSSFQPVQMNENGAFTHNLPKGFLDSQDIDFRAILTARLIQQQKQKNDK